MVYPRRSRGRRRQGGAALLLFLLVVVAVGAYALLRSLNAQVHQRVAARVTGAALAEARAALIGYALAYAETHPGQPQGYLPCPDRDGDGDADTCGAAGETVIGWLPWRTLETGPLRDGAGACLWYVVSGTHKASPKQALTPDTAGRIELRDGSGAIVLGATATGRAIAAVLAPGAALGAQDRRRGAPASHTECGSSDPGAPVRDPANFLEALAGVDNATGVRTGAVAPEPGAAPMPTALPVALVRSGLTRDASGAPVFNDQVVVVDVAAYAPVHRRMDTWVAWRVRQCLVAYAALNDGRYPWAAPVTDLGYDDATGTRFGRVAALLDDTVASSTGAGAPMDGVWPPDPNDAAWQCFDGSGAVQDDWRWWWWPAWRDAVFYAMDAGYTPDQPAGGGAAALTLNGAGTPLAVLLAGRALSGQARQTAAERALLANWLEGDNAAPGDDRFTVAAPTATANDAGCPASGACPP